MKVTVFTKPGCQPCEATKRWLKQKGVNHVVRDVTTDEAAFAEVKRLGYNSVPVVVRDADTNWFGFRPDMLAGLLE